MSVAPQVDVTPRRYHSKKQITAPRSEKNLRQDRFCQNPVPSRISGQKVEKLSARAQQPPIWLRTLLLLQYSSSVLTACLIAAILTVYALTVYAPQRWSREYKKLMNLQRDERQLTAANESLKNQLAQQAERSDTGLVNSNPTNAIFLPPAPVPAAVTPLVASTNPTTPQSKLPVATVPLAY